MISQNEFSNSAHKISQKYYEQKISEKQNLSFSVQINKKKYLLKT